MLTIKRFIFNAFQVNTYVLFDDSKDCVIIDAACYEPEEKHMLSSYISENNLKPVKQIDTHCHVDHILGNNYVNETYNIGLDIHKEGLNFHKVARNQGAAFGFDVEPLTEPTNYLEEGDIVKFGNSELEILYTPGHVNGSICLVNHDRKFVIVGDVLFHQSIGRTDLPTGNLDVLMHSIKEKLFTLEDDYTVFPGHGPETTIGFEKVNNPFLMGSGF